MARSKKTKGNVGFLLSVLEGLAAQQETLATKAIAETRRLYGEDSPPFVAACHALYMLDGHREHLMQWRKAAAKSGGVSGE